MHSYQNFQFEDDHHHHGHDDHGHHHDSHSHGDSHGHHHDSHGHAGYPAHGDAHGHAGYPAHGDSHGHGHSGSGSGEGFSSSGSSESGEPAKYEFEYDVADGSVEFGHKEQRDGDYTTGTYYVLLPDGRRQVCTNAYIVNSLSQMAIKPHLHTQSVPINTIHKPALVCI